MKRALVVGSQIEGLRGVDADTDRMSAMLEARGFEIDHRTAARASRAGILAGYDALIAASGADDAAVVYYSGHGFYASIASEQLRSWQCIAPTDLRDGGVDDWRGITAWELSIKQAELTARTTNVTVILDCCHASQMSRDAAVRDATARALPHPVRLGFEAHLEALRAAAPRAFDMVDPVGNRDAVRLVACGDTEVAFECANASGEVGGAFTAALIDVLNEVGDTAISWAAIRDAIAARVQRSFIRQRPEIEGPSRRQLFSLLEDDDHSAVAIHAVADHFVLPGGRLTGVTNGDRYAVMPVGSQVYERRAALAHIQVTEVLALSAKAQWSSGNRVVPIDAVAIPIRKQAIRRAVVLDAPAAQRAAVEQAIAATATLRLKTADDTDAIATLKLRDGALTIEDAAGPLFPEVGFPDQLAGALKNLANLGVAQGIRELEGEHGVFNHELEIELGTVQDGVECPLPDHGAALGLGDRLYLKLRPRGYRRLFVHLFNVGVRGKVTLLTSFAPSGIALDGGDPAFALGRAARGLLSGLELTWPSGLPRQTFPRLDEIIVIATTDKTSLRSLETQEVVLTTRGGSKLSDLLAQLQDGGTRDVGDARPSHGFLVKRLSYLLHPRDAAMASPSLRSTTTPQDMPPPAIRRRGWCQGTAWLPKRWPQAMCRRPSRSGSRT
jgi:Caspase domain